MKIKVAVIDEDENYVKRLVSNFQLNYADKVEIYVFPTYEMFETFFASNIVHVILLSEKIAVSREVIPSEVSFARLVSDNAIKEWEGSPAVGKYQKMEMLYKEMLWLYADLKGKMRLKSGGDSKYILFTSTQGGAGTSTTAAAYALFLAKQGKKVLYLNLDFFGNSEIFFQGEGKTGFSDVIYALKSKNEKISIKLESIVRHDVSGVAFFSPCKNTNDMLELDVEEADVLLAALNGMECCEYIVIDISMDFSPICKLVMEKYASDIIMVCDGSDIGNEKIRRGFEVIKYVQQKDKSIIWAKCRLLYNCYQPGTSHKLSDPQIDIVGEIYSMSRMPSRKLADELKNHSAIIEIGI